MREIRYAGKVSAAMSWGRQPIMDYFRKVDDDVVIGLGDIKGKTDGFPLSSDLGLIAAANGVRIVSSNARLMTLAAWPTLPDPRLENAPVTRQVSSVDPDGLLEYSVVFTDRSLNHMSQRFQQVMRDVSSTLKQVYNAAGVAVVPGGGTYGMEAVARQFAQGRRCLVVRNGWFSYRWSQIFEMGRLPGEEIVLKARPVAEGDQAPFAPPSIDEVVAQIRERRPEMVFAPHVETSSGILLPDDYIKAIAAATHEVGGLFVLDCIASGTLWVDMRACGVDLLISAPQKGWSASPCSALVVGEAGRQDLAFQCSAGVVQIRSMVLQLYETEGVRLFPGKIDQALPDDRELLPGGRRAIQIAVEMLAQSELFLAEQLVDQHVLALEITINGAGSHAGRLRDYRHRHAIDAALRKDLQ
jgi:hypothetical protein